MSTNNVSFLGEIRKISAFFVEIKILICSYAAYISRKSRINLNVPECQNYLSDIQKFPSFYRKNVKTRDFSLQHPCLLFLCRKRGGCMVMVSVRPGTRIGIYCLFFCLLFTLFPLFCSLLVGTFYVLLSVFQQGKYPINA